MNLLLCLIGLGKVVFGIVVGAAGIFVASRVLGRMMRWGETEAELVRGNLAAAVLLASGLVAIGILVQHAVTATFSAVDLTYRGEDIEPLMAGVFLGYGLAHVAVSLVVGAASLAAGAWIFGRLTRGIDEMGEVRKGNVGPALVLGAVLIVMALMTAPGLETALDGLLPLPTLARDELLSPS
jgi:uncharacterized membrane protein YjfL (UPF0719 family)